MGIICSMFKLKNINFIRFNGQIMVFDTYKVNTSIFSIRINKLNCGRAIAKASSLNACLPQHRPSKTGHNIRLSPTPWRHRGKRINTKRKRNDVITKGSRRGHSRAKVKGTRGKQDAGVVFISAGERRGAMTSRAPEWLGAYQLCLWRYALDTTIIKLHVLPVRLL